LILGNGSPVSRHQRRRGPRLHQAPRHAPERGASRGNRRPNPNDLRSHRPPGNRCSQANGEAGAHPLAGALLILNSCRHRWQVASLPHYSWDAHLARHAERLATRGSRDPQRYDASREAANGDRDGLPAPSRACGVADEKPVRQQRGQVRVGRREPASAWLIHALERPRWRRRRRDGSGACIVASFSERPLATVGTDSSAMCSARFRRI
jgi:hypothetical protein